MTRRLLVPAAGGVHELIAERAGACPDAVAVASGDGCLTYGGLAERAGRLAGYLREQGAGPECVVGLCLGRGADVVTGMLAAWLAGAAYLPLDPSYPAGRLGFMLADSGARVLVGDRAAAAVLGRDLPAGVAGVWLDDPATAAGIAGAAPAPAVPVAGGQLAYVIYTSGSTGVPKGVMVGHGSLVNYVAWFNRRFAVTSADRFLVSSSPGFDAFGIEVYPGLAAGGALVVAPAAAGDAGVLAAAAARGGVSVLAVVPTVLKLLTAVAGLGRCAAVRQVVCGGEQLTGEVAAALAGRLPVPVHNVYGPTEATIDVTAYTQPWQARGPGRLPIGRPAANTRVYVLDGQLGLVPAGVAGELFVGGAGLARGYLGRPALTAERFVADRFGGGGGRLYRTGDRARWRRDGQLEYLGRADQQVKVRGFRVELEEIEAALRDHPGVGDAVAAVREDAGGDQRLAAWLVPAGPAGIPAADELRAFLGGRLPGFMIPAVFTELAALPLTPNGKIDRAALPAPDATRPEVGGYLAPRGAVEELLAGIWAQVLGLDRAGAQDDFFALGGHSLLATRVISRVREVFGTEVPVAALFDHPTVAGLAAVIAGTGAGPAAPPVVPVPRDGRLPLSFAQQRLWFLAQLEPGSAEYNVPVPVGMRGVDVAALGAALAAVTRRHEVLRTRLVAGPDGVPYQVIDPPGPFPLPVADVSGSADPRRAAEALVTTDMQAPFDLAAGPVIRACLARLAAGEHVLVLSLHHVVSDEWSAGIFRGELGMLYGAFSRVSRIGCRGCRCSMRISRCGSGRGWRGRCWTGSWRTGGVSWRGCRCWSCRRTGRVRRSGRPPGRWRTSPSRRR